MWPNFMLTIFNNSEITWYVLFTDNIKPHVTLTCIWGSVAERTNALDNARKTAQFCRLGVQSPVGPITKDLKYQGESELTLHYKLFPGKHLVT